MRVCEGECQCESAAGPSAAPVAPRVMKEVFEADPETILARLRALASRRDVRHLAVVHGQVRIADFQIPEDAPSALMSAIVVAVTDLVSLLEECTVQVDRTLVVEPPPASNAIKPRDRRVTLDGHRRG